jgi:predicted component of type VI protein secretion system
MLSLTLVGGADRSEGARTAMQMNAGQARLTIGRDPACDWALPDRTLALSARHCEIVRAAAGPVLRDLSTNGTFLNGSPARLPADHPLRDGDRFEAGPFTFQVALKAAEAAPAAEPKSPVTSPAVHTPAPRGRDPAAMAAAMPLPPAPVEEDLGLTRIRPAPAAAAKPVPKPAAAAPTPMPPAMPSAPAAPIAAAAAPADWLPALARGLGLPPQALAGHDAAQLAEQLGRLARISVEGLQKLLEQKSRSRRRIGSRKQAELKAASPLRLAGGTDEALLALLAGDPAASVQQAVADLTQHQDGLLAAYRGAMQRLAEDLAPSALAASLPVDDPARRWALYAVLWQRLGLTADDAPWTAGFVEAALLHLAAQYDRAE